MGGEAPTYAGNPRKRSGRNLRFVTEQSGRVHLRVVRGKTFKDASAAASYIIMRDHGVKHRRGKSRDGSPRRVPQTPRIPRIIGEGSFPRYRLYREYPRIEGPFSLTFPSRGRHQEKYYHTLSLSRTTMVSCAGDLNYKHEDSARWKSQDGRNGKLTPRGAEHVKKIHVARL